MITRKGKIARLPRAVREELNGRLFEGEPGNQIVTWLNAHEGVQPALKYAFGGRPITEQNLSEWRQGGYQDWLRHQEEREQTDRMLEEAEDYEPYEDEISALDRITDMAVVALGRQLRTTMRMADGPEKHRMIIDLVRELARMRRMAREAEQARREEAEQKGKRDSGLDSLLETARVLQRTQREATRLEEARIKEKEARLREEEARIAAEEARRAAQENGMADEGEEEDGETGGEEETESQGSGVSYLEVGNKSNQIQPDPTKSKQGAAQGT